MPNGIDYYFAKLVQNILYHFENSVLQINSNSA